MSTWLKLLPLELSEVKDFLDPVREVKEGEQTEGPMSEGLKRLYTLWMGTAQQAAHLKVDAGYAPNDETTARADELGEKAEALGRIFWIAVKDELHLWGKPVAVGVRKGFVIISYQSGRPEDLPPFLRQMFGG
jgi:hypothetical protein